MAVVLEPSLTNEVLHQCSRATPERFTGTWRPTAADARRLDEDLGKLNNVVAKLCCMPGNVVHPELFFRQYIGLEIDGQRFIYVNAFEDSTAKSIDWHRVPVVVCDGGDGFWGALYNPRTRSFTDLAVNGIG